MWKILKSSIIGDDHVAENKPCQDSYMIEEVDDDRLILAVADGHGGRFYCRSDLGAQFACESAVEILRNNTIPWESVPAQIKNLYDQKVEAHLLEKPLTDEELIKVNGQVDRVAYGSTLICCSVTREGVFRAQVGDGEIHAVTASGNFLEDLPDDSSCVGFFTTSLASPFAANQFRWRFDPAPPVAVVLYTDGYVSGRTRPWDILELVKTLPEDEKIPQKVLEAGKRGDDQTVLVAIHTDTVNVPLFLDGFAKTESRCLIEERQAELAAKIDIADEAIRAFIQKLVKCDKVPIRESYKIQIRNRLIAALCERQRQFMALCQEYQALEEQKTEQTEEKHQENPDGNHAEFEVT